MHFFLPNTPPAPPIGTLTSHAAARVAGFVTDDNVTMKVNQCEVLRNPAKWNKLKALGLCQSMVIICSVVNGASSGKKRRNSDISNIVTPNVGRSIQQFVQSLSLY